MDEVVLHAGRDRSVRRRHPWLLSGAVARVSGSPAPGDWVRVVSAEGEGLGFGHYSPRSQIRVRLVSFGKDPVDDTWLESRIADAVGRRSRDPLLEGTDAVRLVNAEGDGLPGLVADRYRDVVVVRLSAIGMGVRREAIADALRRLTGASAGYERADGAAARREGMAARQGPLWGAAPEAPIPIEERGRRYRVDVRNGQKTGFYLDQRESRDLVARLASGGRILDLFSYTGGFAVAAAQGGAAAVTLVESSSDALALAGRNLEPFATQVALRPVEADAFRFVRHASEVFDGIVADPPPLARRESDRVRATRAHKDLLLFGLRRLAPGGWLLAFSCSQRIGPDLLRKIAFGASLDADRPLQVLAELGAPSDHPVSLDHPEGRYLCGLLLRG